MARMGALPFAFPDFRGATRRLILFNLVAYFCLLIAGFAAPLATRRLTSYLVFLPADFLHGWLWQPITYSLIHPTLIGTLFELLSLWFLASFLETYRGASWVMGLYCSSILGTALAAAAIYQAADSFGHPLPNSPVYGCMGGIFGMLVAIGVLYGDVEFLMFFVVGMKARYMAMIYALVAFAMLFGESKLYAFAQIGGAVGGLLFLRLAPRRGFGFAASEWVYGLRNGYYRWKRRRAGRKFEVYMKKQGRTVRLDGRGRPMGDDPDDRSRWN
jgi:membrane associated rhomboid family serine protease